VTIPASTPAPRARRPLVGWHQIPNAICVLRVVVMCLAVVFIGDAWSRGVPWSWAWLVAGVLAALSDSLDGFLAKRYGWVSALGAFLDQISDKIVTLVVFAFVALVGAYPVWAFGLIVLRELFVSALRVTANQQGIALPTAESGRFKTFVQQVASGVIFVHFAAPEPLAFGASGAQLAVWAGFGIFLLVCLGFGRRTVQLFTRVYRLDRMGADGQVHTSWVDLGLVVLTLACIPLPFHLAGPLVTLVITVGTGITYFSSYVFAVSQRPAPPSLAGAGWVFGLSLLVTFGLTAIYAEGAGTLLMWLTNAALAVLWVMVLLASDATARAYRRGP
jgi:CDP-diacylglycerol---glycerol-3-phosphate 3-phosphatidyltransferase